MKLSIVLSIKKRNLRKFSVDFFKAVSKKRYLADPIQQVNMAEICETIVEIVRGCYFYFFNTFSHHTWLIKETKPRAFVKNCLQKTFKIIFFRITIICEHEID